jgi:hypothetical protein
MLLMLGRVLLVEGERVEVVLMLFGGRLGFRLFF